MMNKSFNIKFILTAKPGLQRVGQEVITKWGSFLVYKVVQYNKQQILHLHGGSLKSLSGTKEPIV